MKKLLGKINLGLFTNKYRRCVKFVCRTCTRSSCDGCSMLGERQEHNIKKPKRKK